MGFLIRCIFWLSLVLLLVPFGGAGDEGENAVGPLRALSAAGDAVRDMAGLCDRQPEVCETAMAAIGTIAARAREGARMAAGMLNEEAPDGQDRALATGSVETGR